MSGRCPIQSSSSTTLRSTRWLEFVSSLRHAVHASFTSPHIRQISTRSNLHSHPSRHGCTQIVHTSTQNLTLTRAVFTTQSGRLSTRSQWTMQRGGTVIPGTTRPLLNFFMYLLYSCTRECMTAGSRSDLWTIKKHRELKAINYVARVCQTHIGGKLPTTV
jgi:hypothetical protein